MRGKIATIQGLRFIAASSVVIDHTIGQLVQKQVMDHHAEQIGWHIGMMGVWTFFVISGFIMIYAEHGNFGSPDGAIAFVQKRALRIIPMYWIITTVYFLVGKHGASMRDIVASYAFFPISVEPGHLMRPILPQGWTINYELFFYVIFAISMLFSLSRGIGLNIAAFLLIVLCGTFITPLSAIEDPITTAAFLTNPIILLFLSGVIIGFLLRKYKLPPYVTINITFQGALVASIGLFFAAGCLFYFLGLNYPMNTYSRMLFWPIAICIVAICTRAEFRESKINSVIVLLGDASYSVYLSHAIVLWAMWRAIGDYITQHNFVLYLVAGLGMANISGLLLYMAVERPLTKRLRHIFALKTR